MELPKWLKQTAFWVITIGGLNLGLVAALNYNAIETLLGVVSPITIQAAWLSMAIGASAVVMLLEKFAK